MPAAETDIDLLSPDVQRDPYPVFAQLRRDAPVVWSTRHRGWLLTRYDDVAAAFREPRLSADRMTPTFARLDPDARARVELAERHLTRWLVFMDPPAHDRLRRIVSRAFTPPRMERVRAHVRSLVSELLAGWRDEPEVDFVTRFAFALPTNVVASVMGVPAADYALFARWSVDVGAVVFGSGMVADRFERAQRGLADFDAYIRGLIDDVHGGRLTDGLVADLVAVHDEGERLDADELVAMCTLLLFAGSETTTTLLTNTVAVLDRHPQVRAALASARDPRAVGPVVEEMLRYEGPTRSMVRHTMAEVDLPSGATVPAGARVFLLVGAANRDPQRFPDPDRFVADRADNVHLGFGSGIHHCLGAPLARIEAQEALAAIYRTYPELHVVGNPGWGGGLLGRSAGRVTVSALASS